MSGEDTIRTWKVVLIVEDQSDGRVCKELIRTSSLLESTVSLVVDWQPLGGIGNFLRKGESYIQQAIDKVGNHGCVAVVVDRDGKDILTEEPHKSIADICRKKNIPLILASEAIEAWLLTDASVCEWLGITPPVNTQTLGNPKDFFLQAYRKKRKLKSHRRLAMSQITAKISNPEESRNLSLKRAFNELKTCL